MIVDQSFSERSSAETTMSGRGSKLRSGHEQRLLIAEVDATTTPASIAHVNGQMQTDFANIAPASLANAELRERIDQALRVTGYLPLRDVGVIVAEGLIILRGRLPSYHLKQVALEVVRSVPGVSEVHDDLKVISPRSIPR